MPFRGGATPQERRPSRAAPVPSKSPVGTAGRRPSSTTDHRGTTGTGLSAPTGPSGASRRFSRSAPSTPCASQNPPRGSDSASVSPELASVWRRRRISASSPSPGNDTSQRSDTSSSPQRPLPSAEDKTRGASHNNASARSKVSVDRTDVKATSVSSRPKRPVPSPPRQSALGASIERPQSTPPPTFGAPSEPHRLSVSSSVGRRHRKSTSDASIASPPRKFSVGASYGRPLPTPPPAFGAPSEPHRLELADYSSVGQRHRKSVSDAPRDHRTSFTLQSPSGEQSVLVSELPRHRESAPHPYRRPEAAAVALVPRRNSRGVVPGHPHPQQEQPPVALRRASQFQPNSSAAVSMPPFEEPSSAYVGSGDKKRGWLRRTRKKAKSIASKRSRSAENSMRRPRRAPAVAAAKDEAGQPASASGQQAAASPRGRSNSRGRLRRASVITKGTAQQASASPSGQYTGAISAKERRKSVSPPVYVDTAEHDPRQQVSATGQHANSSSQKSSATGQHASSSGLRTSSSGQKPTSSGQHTSATAQQAASSSSGRRASVSNAAAGGEKVEARAVLISLSEARKRFGAANAASESADTSVLYPTHAGENSLLSAAANPPRVGRRKSATESQFQPGSRASAHRVKIDQGAGRLPMMREFNTFDALHEFIKEVLGQAQAIPRYEPRPVSRKAPVGRVDTEDRIAGATINIELQLPDEHPKPKAKSIRKFLGSAKKRLKGGAEV